METEDPTHVDTPKKKKPPYKVGETKAHIIVKKWGKETKERVLYTYKDFEYDADGWTESAKYLPEDYDLVYMRLAIGKTIPGWHTNRTWYGVRLKQDDVVLLWKRKEEERY